MVFTGCKDDDTFTGVDKSLPGPVDLVYDDILSTSEALVVNWKKGETAAAGATSYTIQLADSDTSSVNQYGGLSAIIQADEDMSYTFAGLSPYKLYYARVRANYPKSVFSDWVYITLGNENKKYATELGYGIVDPSLPSIDKITYDGALSSETSMGFGLCEQFANPFGQQEIFCPGCDEPGSGKRHLYNIHRTSEKKPLSDSRARHLHSKRQHSLLSLAQSHRNCR